MLQPGSVIGGYEILEPLGRGATATTWRARGTSNDREVALKVPHPRLLRDPSFVVRFLQEAKLDTRLDSPFVVRVFEVGEHDGTPFMAMELLHGLTLGETLATSGPLPVRRALQIARDIAIALDHAHGAGVVHRDLKPDNIMLRVGQCLKVMDFGIAKVTGDVGLTASDVFIGTPAYAAPEMVDAAHVDHRADLYALGIVLFEMLEGSPPFTGASAVEVVMKHRDEPLPPLSDLPRPIPADIYRVILELCAKHPWDRVPDARSAKLALELVLPRVST